MLVGCVEQHDNCVVRNRHEYVNISDADLNSGRDFADHNADKCAVNHGVVHNRNGRKNDADGFVHPDCPVRNFREHRFNNDIYSDRNRDEHTRMEYSHVCGNAVPDGIYSVGNGAGNADRDRGDAVT